jgi:hypothetical protein
LTVAFDQFTTSIRTATTDPWTFNHTPVGTPRAVVLAIINYTDDADELAASPTYGGVTMTPIIAGTDAAGEPTRTALYFLGSNIPTGQQQVSIDFLTTSLSSVPHGRRREMLPLSTPITSTVIFKAHKEP